MGDGVHGRTKDRDCVRGLAAQVAGIAQEPRMAGIRRRWRDVNALRKPDRAPVWCRPVGCWCEILQEDSLVCTEPWLRGIEYQFRQIIHKRSIDDDSPVEGWYSVGAVFRCTPDNRWGVDIHRHESGAQGGAWAYDPPLKDPADFDRLAMPAFTYDEDATRRRLERTAELLDGILPARLTARVPLGATLGTAAADLRGLEQMMIDMAMAPELMHRLMGHLRDATLAAMDTVERTGLLTPTNLGPMTCSDPPGGSADGRPLTCKDLWCMANSQEFDRVSPAMWQEFCLDYQKPIF